MVPRCCRRTRQEHNYATYLKQIHILFKVMPVITLLWTGYEFQTEFTTYTRNHSPVSKLPHWSKMKGSVIFTVRKDDFPS